MMLTRRNTLRLMAAGAGTALMPGVPFAQEGRALRAQILGYTLSIHVPAIAAVNEGMVELGYAPSDISRMESMQVMTQSIVARSAEVGESDVVSALRASEAGADIRLIGLVYNNTSQVLVVNADKVSSYEDFKNPRNAIALNSTGDFIYVMLSGVFEKNGVDIDEATLVEVGGSGSRMRALLAGRVAAVPVHFDQAEEIVKEGNFKVMVEPGKVYDPWLSEAWLVGGDWLQEEANQQIATDLVKATITSFRRANEDLGYFGAMYRKYSTVSGAAEATDESLEGVWNNLVNDIQAWPADGGFHREDFAKLVPTYMSAGALRSEPDLQTVIDTTYVERALKELD